MLELRTLGTVDVRRDGASVLSVLSQPTRMALLIYLAVARPRGPHRRDVLLPLLWPERDEQSSRSALRQTLFRLRQSVGDGVVEGAGEQTVAVADDLLWCDATAFEEALDAGDGERALELYRGPFLKGFHLPDSPEFERWADGERQRLARRAVEVARELAGRAEARGDLMEAVEWARRATALDPYDEGGWRRLMELLDRKGDRAAALRAHEECRRRLEEELGIEPSPETRAVVEAIRGREAPRVTPHASPTPRSPAAARGEPAVATGAGAAPEAASPAPREPTGYRSRPPGDAQARRSGRRFAFALLAAGLVGAGAIGLVRGFSTTGVADREPDPRSIAVLPFENVGGDPDEAYFSAGITNEIITQLSRIGALTVVSRTSSVAYDEARRPLPEIATELGVDRILEGTVQREGGRLRITAQLIDGGSDRHLWAESYDRNLEDIFAIQTDVARRVAEALEARLTPAEARRLDREPTRDLEAYTLYLKGRFVAERRTADAFRQAIGLYRHALERDSTFAAAWAGVADAYVLLLVYGSFEGDLSREAAVDSAEGPARRALALDGGLAEAHVAMGGVWSLKRDRDRHMRSYRRAVELNPSYAYGRHVLGHALAYVEGRLEEALGEVRRAVWLDPLAPVYTHHLARLLYLSGDYDAAARQYRAMMELAPDFRVTQAEAQLARALAVGGRHGEARQVLDATLERDPDDPRTLLALGVVRALAGERSQALATLERAEAAGADSISLGVAYAALGAPERDRALALLSARFEGFGVIKTLAWDPLLDPLRPDPRFREILERVAADWKVPHLPATGAR